jgi:hypothetical protein
MLARSCCAPTGARMLARSCCAPTCDPPLDGKSGTRLCEKFASTRCRISSHSSQVRRLHSCQAAGCAVSRGGRPAWAATAATAGRAGSAPAEHWHAHGRGAGSRHQQPGSGWWHWCRRTLRIYCRSLLPPARRVAPAAAPRRGQLAAAGKRLVRTATHSPPPRNARRCRRAPARAPGPCGPR